MPYDEDMLQLARQGEVTGGLGYPTRLSLRERIQRTIQAHEAELERNKKLLTLLDANPAIEQFMDLSQNIKL